MCEFGDYVDDGILVQLLRWNGKPVMCTTNLRDDYSLSKLIDIWHEFRAWKTDIEPGLPEERKLFCTSRKDKKGQGN